VWGGVIITVLFPCYLFQSFKSEHLHDTIVAFAYLLQSLDCNWSVMTIIVKDNFVDSLAFECPTRWFYVWIWWTLTLDTSFVSWMILLRLPIYKTTTYFSFFEWIYRRYFQLVKMIHSNKKLAYGTAVEWSMCVCWLMNWYRMWHIGSCMKLLLGWFWCAVDIVNRISEELWTNDEIDIWHRRRITHGSFRLG